MRPITFVLALLFGFVVPIVLLASPVPQAIAGPASLASMTLSFWITLKE